MTDRMTAETLALKAGDVLRAFGANPDYVLKHHHPARMADDIEVTTREGPRAIISFNYRGEDPRTTFLGLFGRYPTHNPLDPRAD